jgi:hypothetical protein
MPENSEFFFFIIVHFYLPYKIKNHTITQTNLHIHNYLSMARITGQEIRIDAGQLHRL